MVKTRVLDDVKNGFQVEINDKKAFLSGFIN
jgi:hypothetical protein